MNRKLLHSSLTILLAAAAAACGGSSSSSKAAISGYVAGVQSSDGSIQATLHAGAPPAAVAGTASLTASAVGGTFIPGGTSSFLVSETATRFIVAVDDVDGYWELTGLTPASGQTILVTFAQTSHDPYVMEVGAGDGTSIFGYTPFSIVYTSVGTGQVQVNVTWDKAVDVDLHVLDPSGEELYYDNKLSASGGALDLDANAGCDITEAWAENVTWATGTAPSGTYKVLIDYWSACSITDTVSYVVTVNVAGQTPRTFARTLTAAEADSGDTCFPTSGDVLLCGTQITTFTVP
jgi:hypothetical protein